MLFFLNSCHIVAALFLRRAKIFWKINLEKIIEIYQNNLNYKVLKPQIPKQRPGLYSIIEHDKGVRIVS
jgi:hypothetical protein